MWTLPFSCGGPERTYEQERDAILAEHEGVIGDIATGTELECEVRGDAVAIAMIRAINDRQAQQNFPFRMLDGMRKWETALSLRPTRETPEATRAAAIAAKLRGFSGNAPADQEQIATDVAGVRFVEIRQTAPADEITYWPGVNPGPPGFELCSNRCYVAFVLTKDGLSDDEFVTARNALTDAIDDVRPDWQTFNVGTADMIADVDLIGQGIVS